MACTEQLGVHTALLRSAFALAFLSCPCFIICACPPRGGRGWAHTALLCSAFALAFFLIPLLLFSECLPS